MKSMLNEYFAMIFGQAGAQSAAIAFGWAIVHSLWQGALVSVVLALVLRALKKNASVNRYSVSVTALFAMLLMFGITFFVLYESSALPHPKAVVLQDDSVYAIADAEIASQLAMHKMQPAYPSWLVYYYTTVAFIYEYLPLIVLTWMLGVLMFSIRFFGGLLYVRQLKQRMTYPVPAEWHARMEAIGEKIGLNRAVQMLESGIVQVPMVIGWLRPVILMPAGMLSGLSVQEVESILAHELAHIRRQDYLVNLFQSVAEIILFYHPATWWISSVIGRERENCCDDMAVAVTGNSLTYARALTNLEELKLNHYSHSRNIALAFGGREGSLLHRIKRLVTAPQGRDVNNKFAERFAAASIVMFGIALITLSTNTKLLANDNEPKVLTHSSQIVVVNDTIQPKDKDKEKAKEKEKNRVTSIIIIDGDSVVNFGGFPPDVPLPPLPPLPPVPPVLINGIAHHDFDFDFDFDFDHDDDDETRVYSFSVSDTAKFKKQLRVDIQKITALNDSLFNTPEFKAAIENYSRAAADYRKLVEEKLNDPKVREQLEAYEKAMEEYEDALENHYEDAMEARRDAIEAQRDAIEARREIEHRRREAEHDRREMERDRREIIRETERIRIETKHRGKIADDLAKELRADQLISENENEKFEFKMTREKLFVNGKEQSKAMFKKYRKFIEEKMGDDLDEILDDDDSTIIIIGKHKSSKTE